MTKKVLLIVFGGVAVLIGVALGIGGGVLVAVAGGDGYFSSATTPIGTPTYALVSDAAVIDTGASSQSRGLEASLRLTARAADGGAVFLGIAPAAVVDRYLSDVPYDELRDLSFSPLRYDTERHPGTGTPEPPAQESGWTRRVSGTGDQVLEFDLRDAAGQRIVVMNADAAERVDVSVTLGVRVPLLRTVGVGLLAGAGVFLVGGLFLLVWGVRTKATPKVPPPVWGGYGGWGAPGGPPGAYSPQGYPPSGYPPQGYPPPGPPPPGPAAPTSY